MAGSTLSAFVVGAGLLAIWIDARHPKLAPESLSRRVLAAACAAFFIEAMPVFKGSTPAVYTSLFGIVLPVFVCSFLTAVWLLRALRDAQLSH